MYFKVLVPSPRDGRRLRQARHGQGAVQPLVGLSGSVDYDHAAVFTHMQGQRILCRSGNLWLTVENDRVDHVLAQGQDFPVTRPGKVILSGRGDYMI
jgi:hypothetical protein